MSKYEVRKGGKVYACWTLEELTPPRETIAAMKAAGYRLYIDGRLQR